MKKPIVPQFEFIFAADSFNLAGQSTAQAMPSAPKIMAEMSDAEREAVRSVSASVAENEAEQSKFDRAQSEARQTTIPERSCLTCGKPIRMGTHCGVDCMLAEPKSETTPGLQPGSYWTTPERRPMAKALSTMQVAL